MCAHFCTFSLLYFPPAHFLSFLNSRVIFTMCFEEFLHSLMKAAVKNEINTHIYIYKKNKNTHAHTGKYRVSTCSSYWCMYSCSTPQPATCSMIYTHMTFLECCDPKKITEIVWVYIFCLGSKEVLWFVLCSVPYRCRSVTVTRRCLVRVYLCIQFCWFAEI